MTQITLPRMNVLSVRAMSVRALTVVALLVVPAWALGQATEPASSGPATAAQAASQPAVQADYSSPKAALLTLSDAVSAQDMGTIRNALTIGDEDKAKADVLLDTFGATVRLSKAVRTKYGEKAYREFRQPGEMENVTAARKALINTADVKVTGDTATMTFHPASNSPARAAGSLKFRKVGEDWKVDAGSLFKLDDPDRAAKVQRSLPTLEKIGQIYNHVAGDIEAGKYASIQEAQNAVATRVSAAINASTRSATTEK